MGLKIYVNVKKLYAESEKNSSHSRKIYLDSCKTRGCEKRPFSSIKSELKMTGFKRFGSCEAKVPTLKSKHICC